MDEANPVALTEDGEAVGNKYGHLIELREDRDDAADKGTQQNNSGTEGGATAPGPLMFGSGAVYAIACSPPPDPGRLSSSHQSVRPSQVWANCSLIRSAATAVIGAV